MAKSEKKEVQLHDDKLLKALEDALTSGKHVVVPKIDQLAKFKDSILKLVAAGVSAEKIKDIINDSGSGYHFASSTIRDFIALHAPAKKPVAPTKIEVPVRPALAVPTAPLSIPKQLVK